MSGCRRPKAARSRPLTADRGKACARAAGLPGTAVRHDFGPSVYRGRR
jgi:hypothetical protein